MNPFLVQRIDDVWHVVIYDKPMPCSSEQDANVLAQIPVQEVLIDSYAPGQPDKRVVQSIVDIGDEYGLMKMPAFRKLKNWLTKEVA